MERKDRLSLSWSCPCTIPQLNYTSPWPWRICRSTAVDVFLLTVQSHNSTMHPCQSVKFSCTTNRKPSTAVLLHTPPSFPSRIASVLTARNISTGMESSKKHSSSCGELRSSTNHNKKRERLCFGKVFNAKGKQWIGWCQRITETATGLIKWCSFQRQDQQEQGWWWQAKVEWFYYHCCW